MGDELAARSGGKRRSREKFILGRKRVVPREGLRRDSKSSITRDKKSSGSFGIKGSEGKMSEREEGGFRHER